MYNQEQIENLHDQGLMPDWVYYQVNGKSPAVNLFEQHKKLDQRLKERKEELERKTQEEELEKQINSKAEEAIEKALDRLFKNWQ